MPKNIHILGIAGSLREKSFNHLLLAAAENYLPEGVTLEIYDLADIPIFNQDVQEAGYPEAVQHFRDQIAAADAILIATPEYNWSIPGVLKNAIDWASRPPSFPLNGKPVALMGASTGLGGTVRAQLHLYDVFACLNMYLAPKPEIVVRKAAEKFDEHGQLTDDDLGTLISSKVEALVDMAHKLGGNE